MAKQTWMPIFGNVKIKDGSITLVPTRVPATLADAPVAENAPPRIPHAVVRSNIEFEQGTIAWEGKLSEHSSRAQLILPAESGPASAADAPKIATAGSDLYVGLNVLNAPYGMAMYRNSAFEGVGGSGHGSALPTGEWIPLRLTVRGSNIELYVHGVKVVTASRTLKRGPIGVFLQGNGDCAIRNLTTTQDSPTCFAVMQFTEEFNVLYTDVIKPVCESYGYKVIRGDDFYTAGQIMEDVTESIRSSALIIADVTPDNANVFYEVGYAHAIGKPTILLSDRKRERLPFDISGFRTLFYDNTIGGKAIVEARLTQHLDALHPK